MDKTERLTLYVPIDLKKKLMSMAKSARPKTSVSALGIYLLELGLKEYNHESIAEERYLASVNELEQMLLEESE